MRFVQYSFLFLLLILVHELTAQEQYEFKWEPQINLPALSEQEDALGFAGLYAGEHNGVLLLAGGANFPDGLPWEGGKKRWWNQIYVLETSNTDTRWNSKVSAKLPEPMGYGASVATPNGVLIIGGENESGPLKSVYLLSWNPTDQEVEIQSYPDLPVPLSHSSATLLGSKVYLAGGESEQTSDGFWVLDLEKPNLAWKTLNSWPGEPRSNAVLVSQGSGEEERLYLLGGRKKTDSGVSELFSDIWVYSPSKKTWELEGDILNAAGDPLTLSAFSAISVGSGHILIIGGVTGENFSWLEKVGTILVDEDLDPLTRDSLIQERNELLTNHPGFSKKVLAYHTVTKTWFELEPLQFQSPVNTLAVAYQGSVLLPSGEISPGIRSPKVQKLTIHNHQTFGTLNYVVLIAYLVILIFIGILVSKKQKSTSDYFKAGGRVPWWAAGISVFGTQLSAITFMAIPAKTFATDWTLFILLMTIIMVAPVIIYLFLPFFRRLNLTTAYEYLELRFNSAVRFIGSFLYVVLQVGRLGIVLLLPSLALSVVTGMNVELCILAMGALSIFYTVLGGIEAVIWTDVVQVVVLLGGALICLVLMLMKVEMSFSELVDFAIHSEKTKLFDTSFDFTGTALWVVLFGGIATNIVQYGSDQTVIQRYLTTKDEKTAAQGIRMGAWLALPAALIFFSIGTALYLFYSLHPTDLPPVINNTDSIFPWYIVTQLPQGVSGLLIAAVFAAAMSSLDSSMNSVATVVTTDLYSKLFPTMSLEGRHKLNFARLVTVIIGVAGTVFALIMANMGISSLWDQFNMIIGLFAGGLGGIFLVGILSTRANGNGALMGLISSGIIQYIIKYHSPLSIHLYALTGLISAVVFTYLFSLLFKKPEEKSIVGLTYSTLKKK